MAIESAPYWFAKCDNCGKRANYSGYDNITAWEQKDAAAYEAIAADWTERDGRWHCTECPPLDVENQDAAVTA